MLSKRQSGQSLNDGLSIDEFEMQTRKKEEIGKEMRKNKLKCGRVISFTSITFTIDAADFISNFQGYTRSLLRRVVYCVGGCVCVRVGALIQLYFVLPDHYSTTAAQFFANE